MWEFIYIFNMWYKKLSTLTHQPKLRVLFKVFLANPNSDEKVPLPADCSGCCWAGWTDGWVGLVGELGPMSFIRILSNILPESKQTI